MPHGILEFLRGATMMADVGIALFFLQYWKETQERLFIYFAIAFFTMSLSQVVVLFVGDAADFAPFAYLMRAAAFVLIIVGIIEKNMPSKGKEN